MTNIGKQLRALRTERGWTQAELGARAGLHGKYVQHIEAGRRGPGDEIIVKLATALGCTTDALLIGPSPELQPQAATSAA